MASTGFHKAHCKMCNRITWHYKEGDKAATCTDHCDYVRRVREPIGTVQGGSLYSRLADDMPSEREIRIANRLDRSLWQYAEERRTSQVDVSNEAWAQDIFPDTPATPTLDPDKQYCSFCGDPVDTVNTLTEKKPVIRKVTDMYKDSTGEVHIQERITSRSETLHACPNCVLNIRKPIVVRRV